MADENKEPRHVPGSETWGETVKARGGKRQARAYWLRDKAENRLLILLAKGEDGDRLASEFPHIHWRDVKPVSDMVEFGKLPDRIRLAVLRGERKELEKELDRLMATGNFVKQRMLAPAIAKQIEELDDSIGYIAKKNGEPEEEK